MAHRSTGRLVSLGAILAISALLVVAVAVPATAVTIPTVPVGNAGNTADTEVMTTDGTTGYGSVAYNYRIGTTEVSNAQYAEFLNAKAASDPMGLYNTLMGSFFGGIARSGSSGAFTYATIAGRGAKPVNFVSWYDSIRFANWLNNGQGTGDTETGAYTLLGGGPGPLNGGSITRNAGATWFLASEDEWYKAAYYDPSDSSYFDYPTASNSAPTAEAPPGGSNSANYSPALGVLTDIGAYTASTSPYGTFDQGGNVLEWNEALTVGLFRGLRGGTYIDDSDSLLASYRFDLLSAVEINYIGFRVATVPEPSTGVLAIVGCGLMLWWRKRRK